MSAAMNFLIGLGPWLWLILAVLLFALETVVPGVHFLWFGSAAVLTGLLGLATGASWQVQVVAFAVLSIAAIFLGRRYSVSASAVTDAPNLNIGGAEFIGRVVVVEEPIRGSRGKVRVGDTLWAAEGPEAPAGARMRVKGTDGPVLIVERE